MITLKKSTILVLLLLLGSFLNQADAEVIGDSIVSIYNNWNVGDTAKYTSYSSSSQIENSDTIALPSTSITFEISLTELLSNGDLVFETRTQMPEMGKILVDTGALKSFFERVLNIMEKPQELITDPQGVVKDYRNFDDYVSELDTCRAMLREWAETLDMPYETKTNYINGMEKFLDASLSKESLLKNVRMFHLYGKTYDIGTCSYDIKMPVPFFGNKEVDARVDLTCEVLETGEDYQIVSIHSLVNYDSDQLMDLFTSAFLTDRQIRDANLDDPERPYISIIQSENNIIEALSGTILQIEKERWTTTPDGGRIERSLVKITD